MPRFWRLLLKASAWLLRSLFALLVVWMAVNWRDQDLTSETRAMLVARPNSVTPEENLYLALLGFDAPPGQSLTAAGLERIDEYEKDLAISLKDRRYLFPSITEAKRETLKFQGKIDFCQPLRKSCLVDVETRKAEIGQLLKSNQELELRYSQLHSRMGYYETATPSFLALIAFPPQGVRHVHLADIALRVKTGTPQRQAAALAELRNDMRTWRLMLTGDGALISKMVAIAFLHEAYVMLADVVADGDIDLRRFSSEIRSMLELPKGDDWKIGNAYAFECRVHAYFFDQLRFTSAQGFSKANRDESDRWWDPYLEKVQLLFLKFNATQNLQAAMMTQLKKMADAGPGEYYAARRAYNAWLNENIAMGPHYFYNPYGKTMVAVGAGYFEEYPLRIYDIAAFQRLVRLGYEIRSRRVEPENIQTFMNQHPEWATHPVDGKPFVWAAKKGEVSMQPLGNEPKDRRFGIPIWSIQTGQTVKQGRR